MDDLVSARAGVHLLHNLEVGIASLPVSEFIAHDHMIGSITIIPGVLNRCIPTDLCRAHPRRLRRRILRRIRHVLVVHNNRVGGTPVIGVNRNHFVFEMGVAVAVVLIGGLVDERCHLRIALFISCFAEHFVCHGRCGRAWRQPTQARTVGILRHHEIPRGIFAPHGIRSRGMCRSGERSGKMEIQQDCRYDHDRSDGDESPFVRCNHCHLLNSCLSVIIGFIRLAVTSTRRRANPSNPMRTCSATVPRNVTRRDVARARRQDLDAGFAGIPMDQAGGWVQSQIDPLPILVVPNLDVGAVRAAGHSPFVQRALGNLQISVRKVVLLLVRRLRHGASVSGISGDGEPLGGFGISRMYAEGEPRTPATASTARLLPVGTTEPIWRVMRTGRGRYTSCLK